MVIGMLVKWLWWTIATKQHCVLSFLHASLGRKHVRRTLINVRARAPYAHPVRAADKLLLGAPTQQRQRHSCALGSSQLCPYLYCSTQNEA